MLIGAWFLMTLGLILVFKPIVRILNILPGLGSMVQGVLFIIFGIFSAIIVTLGFVGIKFWWLFLILGLLGIAYGLKKKSS